MDILGHINKKTSEEEDEEADSSACISTTRVMATDKDSADSAETQDTAKYIAEWVKVLTLRRPTLSGISRKKLKAEKLAV